jgi:MFS family permease
VLAIGAPLFCIGLAIGATAPSMLVLVGGRVVQGLGAGAISSVANTAVGRAYPPRLRATMLAVMSSSWVVPGLVGPGLSALVTTTIGWRWVFAGLIPVVVFAAIMTLPALRQFGPTTESIAHGATRRTSDPLLVAVGLGFVVGGLTNARDLWPLVFAALGAGIAAPALVRLAPPGTLRLRNGAPAAIALNLVINFSFFATDAFVPLAVTHVRHRAVGFAGLALTTGALSWTVGAWVTARFNERVSAAVRVRAGFVCVAAGVSLVFAGLHPGVPSLIFPVAWVIAGLGMGLGYQGLALTVLNDGATDDDSSGPAAATVSARQVFDVVGTAVGTGVAGACVAVATAGGYSTKSGLSVTFGLMIAVALFGAAVSGRVQATTERVDARPAPLP